MSKLNRLKQQIALTLATALIGLIVLLPSPAKANIVLGVVKTSSNSESWNQITNRLEGSSISYRAIALEQINSIEDLKGIPVLFLPNIETLDDAQLKVLQEWTDRGGRLIASGPIGRKSSARVRQQLRSLLGSYWAFELDEPTTPQGLNRCLNVSCSESTNWVPSQRSEITVRGAALIPSGINSSTAATWQDGVGSSAVIVAPQATYLGWYWGESADASIDTIWMQAILNRYSISLGGEGEATSNPQAPENSTSESLDSIIEELNNSTNSDRPPPTGTEIIPPPPTSTETIPPPPTSTETIPPPPPFERGEPEETETTPVPPLSRAVRGARNETEPTPVPPLSSTEPTPVPPLSSTEPTPVPPFQRGVRGDNTARRSIMDIIRTLPSRQDPSDRTAPPGLEVEPGPEPISNAEVNAMVEELQHLLNRFENAVIAANSTGVDRDLRTREGDRRNLLASRAEAAIIERSRMELADIVARTQKAIAELPELVRERKYDRARQQWLDARELIWENYPTDGVRPGGEIRAVWLDRGTIVRARSPQGLAAVFNRLSAAGINTVFFETINAGYAIYPSNVAPKQNPLTVGWDPLEAAVKLAKERNMELHAWLWTFAVGNKAHNQVAKQPEDYLGPVITANPTWVMTDNQGRTRHINDGKTYMDPANPYVRQYLMQLIDEIADRYGVDGIHLDYIRYPFQDPGANFTHGYGTAAREEFQRLHGVDPMEIVSSSEALSVSDRQMLWKWTEFRIEKVNSFVAEVSRMLRSRYPEVILSAAVFPIPQQERLWKIQQEWETWARRGDVDLLTPMTYALDTNRLQQLAEPITNRELLGNVSIAPAIKLLNLSEIVAIDQVQALRDLPTVGYSIFAAEKINGEFERFLIRTQGPESTRDTGEFTFTGTGRRAHVVEGPIPYRQPFLAAAARYRALKQEWGFLLAEERLDISSSALKDLRSLSRDLEKALERLAKNPSAKRLEKAKRKLSQLQSEFGGYMRSHASDRPLQVQTWENRLVALEMLLNYGEQVRLKGDRF